MKRYILTLAPVDGDGTTATAHIDVNGDGPRLKQITFTAADGGYLPKMPFDLEGFIAAVMPGSAPAVAAPQPAAATAVPPVAAAPAPAAATTAVEAVTTAQQPVRRRAARVPSPTTPAKATAKAAAPETRVRKGPAVKKTTAVKKATAVTKAAPAKKTVPAKTADTTKERAYNKMPDDFVQTFGKTTMADLATVYNVPLHTVAGWVKTARKQGLIAPATPRRKSSAP